MVPGLDDVGSSWMISGWRSAFVRSDALKV